MKKLVVLLAAVMMFAFSATAYAATFTDLEDKSVTVQDAVAKTVALGIIDGYTDGTFGADKNITRAEFAKIAVTAAGSADTATMLEKTASSFKDVKAGAWYTGWVNAAESLGLVQGVGNGNYNPNATITNQEVVTVMLRMLGYNDNLPGNWPVNYVTQANKVDILDNVAIVAAAPATRGDVVVMLSDLLDANMVTYDKDTNEFVNKQTTKGGNDREEITLLDDSFDGAFEKVVGFEPVDDVRDVAKKQLTWTSWDDSEVTSENAVYANTYIIDENTRVSVNGGDLFSLEGHQGKVYFVEDNDKLYARFIEVESYIKTVSDAPKFENGKVVVNNTKYNAYGTPTFTTEAAAGEKNSKFLLYFNDDDQVYAVASDKNLDDKAFFVKSISNSTIKLAGSDAPQNIDNDDDEVLIWNGEEYIAPSELKVGDAVIRIADDLYEMTTAKTGTLKSQNTYKDGVYTKYNIDGTNYVQAGHVELDDEFEDFDGDIADVFGTSIQYLVNDDNTLSAIVVDDVVVGNKLYGVVTGGDGDTATSWTGDNVNTLSIFTQEGATVEYALDRDEFTADELEAVTADNYYGKLVEYKLTDEGDIKSLKIVGTDEVEATANVGETLVNDDNQTIKVNNNAYLSYDGKNVTLSNDVVVFEITADDDELDVNLVTRAALLSGDDFTPGEVAGQKALNGDALDPYCAYVVNSNGAVKAMAYTDADTTTYHSGVIDEWAADGDGDITVTFVGDDATREFVGNDPQGATGDDLVIYTLSGGDIDVTTTYAEKAALDAVLLKGWSGGLMTFGSAITPAYGDFSGSTDTIMTNDSTVVYVQDKTGYFVEGTLADITKNAWVVVPVVDEDGYAEIVIVDEYTKHVETTTTPGTGEGTTGDTTTTPEGDTTEGDTTTEGGTTEDTTGDDTTGGSDF